MGNLPAHTWWALSGVVCLGLGLLVPEPTIPAIGLAAILTAILATVNDSIALQFGAWVGLSILLAVLLRALVPRESQALNPPTEAWVTTTIPAGGIGQVLYEGASWQARCESQYIMIPSGQPVHVVGLRGVTLIVSPLSTADREILHKAP